jgi:hypothetical protein
MSKKNLLFVFIVIAVLSSAISAQVPDKQKVIAGAERPTRSASWAWCTRLVT